MSRSSARERDEPTLRAILHATPPIVYFRRTAAFHACAFPRVQPPMINVDLPPILTRLRDIADAHASACF